VQRKSWWIASLGALVVFARLMAMSEAGSASATIDPDVLFTRAEPVPAVGIARKTKLVDARAAAPGEIIVTVIAGEGKETQSKPAEPGDMVVRNRCPATGNEEYLVAAKNFPDRYGEPLGPADSDGWRPFQPKGVEMLYVIVQPQDGAFTFTAPWGEEMVARPGDAIVRDPKDAKDTYRVAASSFECSYEIVKPAGPSR
jgi:hypothetical protein